MINKIAKSLEKTTIKLWLLFLLISQAIYIIMQIYSIPRISHEAGGLLMFDMNPLGYTYEYAYKFLSQLSQKGYDLYKYVQLPLDTLFPILNCLTGLFTFTLIIRIYNKINNKSGLNMHPAFIKALLSLPLIAMSSDYLENIMIYVMLSYKSEVPKTFVYVADIFTIMKSMSTSIFYIIIIIICIIGGVTWINNRIKEKQTDGKFRIKREENSTFEGIYTGRNASSAENQKS
jgi:hypothetical protein